MNKTKKRGFMERLTYILMGIATICLLYYFVCVIRSGIRSEFSLVWLVVAIVLGIASFGCRYFVQHNYTIPRAVTVIGVGIVFVGVTIFTITEGIILYYANQEAPEDLDYVIVLGAKVRGTTITKSLQKRLDTTLEYVESNPNTKIIVSGGQGPDEDISEAEAMAKYLVQHGISEEQIILEKESTNTNENILFSKEALPDGKQKIGIITNGFHVFRATSIANKNKIGKVYGIGAPSDPFMCVNYYVREVFAVLKDKLVGNL